MSPKRKEYKKNMKKPKIELTYFDLKWSMGQEREIT